MSESNSEVNQIRGDFEWGLVHAIKPKKPALVEPEDAERRGKVKNRS
jgi:hypothetical protein